MGEAGKDIERDESKEMSMDESTAAVPARGQRKGMQLLSSADVPRSLAVEILTSPEAVADFIRTDIPWIIPAGAVLAELRPRILRNRMGSRQVVLYRLFFSAAAGRRAGTLKIVFKRYADRIEGRKTYDIMKMLWERGFNRKSRLRILEPYAYREDLGLMVMEDAHGMLLVRNLRQKGPAAVARMKAVARWLSRLHNLEADFSTVDLHPPDEISIRDFVREAGGGEPWLLPQLAAVEATLLARMARFPNPPLNLTHGDFQCENILVDADKVIVVDFDRFCVSDPARDLGCMIAQTRTMGLLAGASSYAVQQGLEAFWEEYRAAVPAAEREALSVRTCLFAARKCLQNIYYMAVVLPVEKKETLSILLREVERFSRAGSVEEVLPVPIAFGHGRPSFVNGRTPGIKQAFAEKIIDIGRPEFLRRHVCPLIPECRPEDVEVITRHNDGIGPAAIEFRISGAEGFMGMLYRDDSGARAHAALTALWKNGFAGAGPCRVTEPLEYIADYRLLLHQKPCGECLDARLDRDTSATLAGVKAAARWLVQLHDSSLRVGVADHPWPMVEKLAEGLTALAAAHPGESERMVALFDRLTAAMAPFPPEEVQVHGCFRPSHVFVDDGNVCAVRFDRCRPSDPAGDLAEFVHRLRTDLYRLEGTFDRADLLTAAFLGEYAARRPAGLAGLPLQRGVRVLLSLCRHLRQLRRDDPEWKAVAAFYDHEFADSLSRGAAPGQREAQQPAAAASREPGENDFQSRAAELMRPDFVAKVVYPAVCGRSCNDNALPPFAAEIPQEDRLTGRVTVRYRFGDGTSIFGKLYPAAEMHGFEVTHRLRAAGFGDGPYRVAEPLAFVAGHNLLLTRGVEGEPLLNIFEERRPDAAENARRAARWLVRLHTSPLRIGREESPLDSLKLLTTLRHLTKAVARGPRERDRSLEKIVRLCRMAGENPHKPPLVQTHGSFHCEHIFVTKESISLIDFDKSLPGDPARDLAEFLSLLRRRLFKRLGSLAAIREPTRAFLDEYRRHLPENMGNLPLYWGAAILVDLFHYRKRRPREKPVEQMIALLEWDYGAVLAGELIGLSGG
jgi:aminoglycoside phosphotransferase (APT) family kinase protein